jgi:hypothetical protein
MTVNLITLVAFVGGFLGLIALAVALVRRGELHLGPGQRPDDRIVQQPDDAESVDTYLDRMAVEMRLPAGDTADIRAELLDHLADSIAALESEGFDHQAAVREALGRLGPPVELGRQLRAAHQTTGRLFAGAGGGVLAAGGGFFLGYIGAAAAGFVVILVIALAGSLLSRLGVPVPNLSTDPNGSAIGNGLYLAFVLAGAAAVSMRFAVRVSAGLGRRSPRGAAVFWAVAGIVVFGTWVIFGIRGQQSWVGAAVAPAVPVAAALGALYRIDRPMPHVGRWALVVAVAAIVILELGIGLVSSVAITSSGATVEPVAVSQPDFHFDHAAPIAPAEWLPAGATLADDYVESPDGAGQASSYFLAVHPDKASPDPIPLTQILASWHDLRFEAWHAYPNWAPDSPIGVDTSYPSPFVIEPAIIQGDRLDADFHFQRLRDGRDWWFVVTGVGPDGHRYRFSDGHNGWTPFNGSVWDWITAPQ